MKRKQLTDYEIGSARYVIAHAKRQRSRGRQLSMSYLGERDPEMALALAKEVLALQNQPMIATKEEYETLLRRLPIENPTLKDMALLCPHLTPVQAVLAFRSGDGYVALPPLKIKGAFQIVSFHAREKLEDWRWEGDKKVYYTEKRPARLSYSYSGRTPASYADGKGHGSRFSDYRHSVEATMYAEKHWGDDLILDTWASVMNIYVEDPSDLINSRHQTDAPRTKYILHLALSKDYNAFINDYSRQESEHFEEYIIDMTTNPFVWNEMKGGRGNYNNFNCAYCGAGLGLSWCPGCGHKFRDDQSRSGWHTPPSFRQVVHLEEQGHIFKKDPMIAWGREKRSHFKSIAEWKKMEARRSA